MTNLYTCNLCVSGSGAPIRAGGLPGRWAPDAPSIGAALGGRGSGWPVGSPGAAAGDGKGGRSGQRGSSGRAVGSPGAAGW